MQDKNRLRYLMMAGTLTLMVFALVWSLGRSQAEAAAVALPETDTALQAENEQLRAQLEAVEDAYRAQMEQANETIEMLTDELNTANAQQLNLAANEGVPTGEELVGEQGGFFGNQSFFGQPNRPSGDHHHGG